jgi:outer membrane protein TolC
LALKNRKELKLKDQEIAEYEEYQKYYKYNYLPEFSLTGQASRASQTIANNIGINLSWNLFDGASNYYQSQQYNANKLKALQEKESLFQQVKYDVQKAYHELMAYIKQLTAKDAAYKQADNEYNLAKLNYKIGLISKVDLDNSMYNFENAHFAWLTAKINVAIKESELNFACGYPK